MNFKINHISLIESFFYMNKKSRQKLKHLDYEKSLYGKIKITFHHQSAFSAKSCLRPESAPLIESHIFVDIVNIVGCDQTLFGDLFPSIYFTFPLSKARERL